jgi:hypothetical protein
MNKTLELIHLEAYGYIIPFWGLIPNYSPVRFSLNIKDTTSHLTVKNTNKVFGNYLGRAAG